MRKVTATLTILLIFAAILSAAESAKTLFQRGVKAEARQDYEAAYEFYKAAYQQKPEELKYRVPFERTRMLSAASKVISQICSAVGSTSMCVSQMKSVPDCRISADIA